MQRIAQSPGQDGHPVLRALAGRTVIVPALKSISLIRNASASPTRRPEPYSNAATNRGIPCIALSTARTSSTDSTTGNRAGRRIVRNPSRRPTSRPSTCRNRNSAACNACRCVLAATRSTDAK